MISGWPTFNFFFNFLFAYLPTTPTSFIYYIKYKNNDSHEKYLLKILYFFVLGTLLNSNRLAQCRINVDLIEDKEMCKIWL